jgi:hypothetical protein
MNMPTEAIYDEIIEFEEQAENMSTQELIDNIFLQEKKLAILKQVTLKRIN